MFKCVYNDHYNYFIDRSLGGDGYKSRFIAVAAVAAVLGSVIIIIPVGLLIVRSARAWKRRNYNTVRPNGGPNGGSLDTYN